MNPGKADLRRVFRLRRLKLPEATRGAMSRDLCERALTLSCFRKAERVGIYVPMNSEADLTPLLMLAPGKIWCWPRILEGGRMDFASSERSTLSEGKFGIPVPNGSLPECIPDLILAPCLAVDRFGFRLGQGGGYYDRYFAAYSVTAWAVAFPCQVVGKLPREPFDMPVEGILTPNTFLEAQHEV
ncbi:MAG: 5-formyltetrahydrofolate cyclo-ligase [Christensenellales bacterium]